MVETDTKLNRIKTYKIRNHNGGTIALTIPRLWARMRGLEPGDLIGVYSNEEGNLVLIPEKKNQEQPAC